MTSLPTPAAYRIWDPSDGGNMAYLTEAYCEHYQIGWSTTHYVDMGFHEEVGSPTANPALIVMPYTTLRAADDGPLYAGDIISFSIKGITHGPEREDIAAAHVWWCAEDGCWAFGRWTQHITAYSPPGSRVFNWWYTMQDRIDRASIRLLGNLFEHPELAAKLGYVPSL